MATTTARAAGLQGSRLYDYLTTTDHKKIGILYTISSFIFLAIGGLLALGVRAELAQPGLQYMDESVYNQLFTMHASVMIFWVIIPFLAGIGNYIVPLQIGAADMAFPRINALSFWMIPFSGLIAASGFFLGGAADAGWTAYPPLSNITYSPGPGMNLWIMAVILVGTSSILGAVNFLVTVFRMRAPGMTSLAPAAGPAKAMPHGIQTCNGPSLPLLGQAVAMEQPDHLLDLGQAIGGDLQLMSQVRQKAALIAGFHLIGEGQLHGHRQGRLPLRGR